jgi:hypothetical protein
VKKITFAQDIAKVPSTGDTLTDQQLALLRKDIRSIKKQLIAVNLSLTDSEATKFWPLYEQYSGDFERSTKQEQPLLRSIPMDTEL